MATLEPSDINAAFALGQSHALGNGLHDNPYPDSTSRLWQEYECGFAVGLGDLATMGCVEVDVTECQHIRVKRVGTIWEPVTYLCLDCGEVL